MRKSNIFFAIITFVSALNAQNVEQESLEWNKLRIRPSVSMTAPLAHEQDPVLPMGANLEGYYEIGKLADINAGLHYGTFKGVSLGGTYHLSDKIVNRKTRFVVSQTNRRMYFYKGRADYRSVFGPTVNLQVGSYSNVGFYGRLDAGLNFERMSRAYYNGYPSGKNGYSSVKLKAVLAKLSQFEYGTTDGIVGRIGAGGVASYTAELKPWKRITLFADAELGYLAVLGVSDYNNGYTVVNNTDWNLLLGLKLGISVSL